MKPEKKLTGALYKSLAERLGSHALRRRLALQHQQGAHEYGQGKGLLRIQHVIPIEACTALFFKVLGLFKRGHANALDIEVVENILHLPNLPTAFEGYRLLHLSDLHCDIDPKLSDAVIQKLQGIDYDTCVITGDFRNKTVECYDTAVDHTLKLKNHLKNTIYAILGNHDCLELVPLLECEQLQFLLNETTTLQKDGETLHIAGVDDPHFYKTCDLKKIKNTLPEGACTILLSHSPEPYREAEELGFNAILCGHTHGGQICLPGGLAVINNSDSPRSMIAGNWTYGNLRGYTSRGTGCCAVPLRFNCPPEITVHTLTRQAPTKHA